MVHFNYSWNGSQYLSVSTLETENQTRQTEVSYSGISDVTGTYINSSLDKHVPR